MADVITIAIPDDLPPIEKEIISEYVVYSVKQLFKKYRDEDFKISKFESTFSAIVEITNGKVSLSQEITKTKDDTGLNFSEWKEI